MEYQITLFALMAMYALMISVPLEWAAAIQTIPILAMMDFSATVPIPVVVEAAQFIQETPAPVDQNVITNARRPLTLATIPRAQLAPMTVTSVPMMNVMGLEHVFILITMTPAMME